MDSDKFFAKVKEFFPNNIDLMRHLHINACWEYVITERSIENKHIRLHFYLYKKDEKSLTLTKNFPNIEPDLILFFTEKAILSLIQGNPSAEEYFQRYRECLKNPQPEIQVDNKINKSRLKLWQGGYKQWQKEFRF